MATRDSRNWWQGTANPFPRVAVARTSAVRPDAPTITTDAIAHLRQVIDEYVRETLATVDDGDPDEFPPNDGRVIVIEGNYGVGKTHLLLDALGRLDGARRDGLDPRSYRVTPGGSFLLLYTELMEKSIGVDEMAKRVLEFYTDLLIEDLRGNHLMELLIGQLQRDEVDPRVIVERYGLGEGALRAKLRRKLSVVTGDESFSRALMLLLQPELREIVWNWFIGGTPGQLLREHGLDRPIETDIQALEALGVIARLYRRKERRFILAVDEMERLVMAWDRSDQAKAAAFKKLLEVFRGTGALLIMAALPDISEVLPPETRRVDATIEPSALKPADVDWYIKKTVEAVHKGATIEPFTRQGIDAIVYLTGGVAREVVRLCYFAYEAASGTGDTLTEQAINRVALTRSQHGAKEMARADIRRLLTDQARNPREGWSFPDTPGVLVDFWVPVGDDGAGCAVLINDSIFDDHQAGIVAERIARIRASGSGRAIVQVVSGYLPDAVRRQIEEALAEEPLILYSPRSFAEDFTQVLNSVVTRIVGDVVATSASPGTELQILREELDRLVQQQATMVRLIQETTSRDEQLLAEVHRALAAAAAAPRSADADEADDLSSALEELFSGAERSLIAYGDVAEMVNEMFAAAAEDPGAPFSLVNRLRDPDAFSPIGVTAYLAQVLHGFRRSVQGWLSAVASVAHEADRPTALQRESLRGICQTYDALYGVAPLFKLDKLPEITSPVATEPDRVSRFGRTMRRESLREAFDGLGDRVYVAAIGLIESADREGSSRQAG